MDWTVLEVWGKEFRGNSTFVWLHGVVTYYTKQHWPLASEALVIEAKDLSEIL